MKMLKDAIYICKKWGSIIIGWLQFKKVWGQLTPLTPRFRRGLILDRAAIATEERSRKKPIVFSGYGHGWWNTLEYVCSGYIGLNLWVVPWAVIEKQIKIMGKPISIINQPEINNLIAKNAVAARRLPGAETWFISAATMRMGIQHILIRTVAALMNRK